MILHQIISQSEDLVDSDMDYICLTCAVQRVIESRQQLALGDFESTFRALAKAEDYVNKLVDDRGEEFKVFLAILVYPEYVKAVLAYSEQKMDFMGKVPDLPQEWFEVEADDEEDMTDEDAEKPEVICQDERETKEEEREDEPLIEDEVLVSKQEVREEPDEEGAIMEGVGYALASFDSLDEFLISLRPAGTKRAIEDELRDTLVDLHCDVSSLYILNDHSQLALEHLEIALKL